MAWLKSVRIGFHVVAESAFTKALELARHQGTKVFELRAAVSLARLYCATNRGEGVLGLVEPIITSFERGAQFPDLSVANRLLEPAGAGGRL